MEALLRQAQDSSERTLSVAEGVVEEHFRERPSTSKTPLRACTEGIEVMLTQYLSTKVAGGQANIFVKDCRRSYSSAIWSRKSIQLSRHIFRWQKKEA